MRRNIKVQEGKLEIALYNTASIHRDDRPVEQWEAYARIDPTASVNEIVGWATLPAGLTDEQVVQEFRERGII
jgi:hypothetical protein